MEQIYVFVTGFFYYYNVEKIPGEYSSL